MYTKLPDCIGEIGCFIQPVIAVKTTIRWGEYVAIEIAEKPGNLVQRFLSIN
jgi:hypothetical protein